MTTHSSKVAAYYDTQTEPFYLRLWDSEDIHFGLFDASIRELPQALKAMTRAVIAPAGLSSNDVVVDAGCGVGGAAIDVARETGSRVYGLTVSERQVELATEKAHASGVRERVTFIQADCACKLPFDDASIDVVMTIEAACHFEDKLKFLSECRRILRPHGRIVGSDWMSAVGGTRTPIQRNLIDAVESSWCLAGLYTLAQWSTALKDAGFNVTATEDFGDAVKPNAAILAEARLDLQLEAANGLSSNTNFDLWMSQYDSLYSAWTHDCFTVGRFAGTVC